MRTAKKAILLVEDEAADAMLIQEAFEESAAPCELHVVRDGAEALAFLHRKNKHSKKPRPNLIILDLNLPKVDGRRVLEELKEDPVLRAIPVVVLTTSSAPEDVVRTYKSHANAYITKPVELDDFMKVVRAMESFWLEVATLPNRNNGA